MDNTETDYKNIIDLVKKKDMEIEKLFYRIGAEDNQGLWYNPQGKFVGRIHEEFKWLGASDLEMPFERELQGWLSVADSLEHLYQWFSPQEIIKLQQQGFSILEYKASEVKWYDRYQHRVISKESSILTNKLIIA